MNTSFDLSQDDLAAWLSHAEGLHTRGIDMGLARLDRVAQALQPALRFSCPVITVAGTNGKGSTCAMLEAILLASGYRVGVYTSPHLVHFEERCRIDGVPVAPAVLVQAFRELEQTRRAQDPVTPLTYFEFTTLGILRVLQQAALDVVVLEVGLGGRLDAVNWVDTDCAIITSVDVDHVEYLGADREAIGFEKAGIMRAGKPAIVSDPMPPKRLVAHGEAIGAELWLHGRDFQVSGDQQQWAWAGRGKRWAGLAHPALRGANQLINAAGVLAALQALRPVLPVTAQALRQGLATVELPGRFQVKPGQPAEVYDVAHNPHAAATLALNLDAMGFFPRTHAVLGAMADKDLGGLLQRLMPLVDDWYCCDLPLARAASADDLMRVLRAMDSRSEARVSAWPDPAAAMAAARAAADPADRIVVFGSFFTVGGVLAASTR